MSAYDEQAHRLKFKVGRWLRLKAKGRGADWSSLRMHFPAGGPGDSRSVEERLEAFLNQLATDAEHSDLLYRLFSDGEIREQAGTDYERAAS